MIFIFNISDDDNKIRILKFPLISQFNVLSFVILILFMQSSLSSSIENKKYGKVLFFL